MITFQCSCGQNLQVGNELAGCKARCPKCRAANKVPVTAVMMQMVELPSPDGATTVSSNKDNTIPPQPTPPSSKRFES